MDFLRDNSIAWDKKVEEKSMYTQPVSREIVEESRSGKWEIYVIPNIPVHREWFPKCLEGINILCLASGGGQQAPVLAAAGANVTVLDMSKMQLEQDRKVAERDGLSMEILHGDMSDLSRFEDEYFDIVVHPVSNLFVENILPVWGGFSRVLKNKGVLIAGFTNPLLWIFDEKQERKGTLEVKYSIPSSTLDRMAEEEIEEYINSGQTIEFAHTLEEQIQGQIDAGFVITGFYESDLSGVNLVDKYVKTFIATRAIKL